MTNYSALDDLIKSKGVSYSFLARALKLSPTGFIKKLKGEIEFKASEIEIVCQKLGITSLTQKESLFFAKRVDKTSTTKDESDVDES